MQAMEAETRVTVYGAAWYPDCRALKQVLARHLVPCEWRDVDLSEDAPKRAVDGRVRIPTVELADGQVLVEPTAREMLERLRVDAAEQRPFCDVVIIGGGQRPPLPKNPGELPRFRCRHCQRRICRPATASGRALWYRDNAGRGGGVCPRRGPVPRRQLGKP